MNRRQFCLSSLAAVSASSAAPARPNIVFLMADQMRADALAVSGNTFCKTPALDAMAAEGVRFSNAYAPQALCTPSRSSLLTGVYPHTTHLTGNLYNTQNASQRSEIRPLTPNSAHPSPAKPKLLHRLYRQVWHLGEDDPGLFDFFSGLQLPQAALDRANPTSPNTVPTSRRGRQLSFSISMLTTPNRLCFSSLYYPPHNYYDPPKQYEEYYRSRGIDNPGYYGACTAIDHDLGLIFAKLKALGLDRNTFVSFTADHGETFGQRMGSVNKTVSYDDSAKVPLLMRWPAGLPAGAVYEGGTTTLDLMPTILEAAGLPIPERVAGHSRIKEINAHDLGWKGPVFLENITQNQIEGKYAVERAVRTPEWKLILRDHPRDELYNIKSDPGEKRTTSSPIRPRRARVGELAKLVKDWGEKSHDAIAVKLASRYA